MVGNMERAILQYAPNTWNKNELSVSKQYPVLEHENSKEYTEIYQEIRNAFNYRINGLQCIILRNQNLYDYGQLLIREQLKVNLNANKNYYRVRRFITIKEDCLKNALKYNLDYRRCGMERLQFHKKLISCYGNEFILVVLVVTNKPNDNTFEPDCSSDYYIEYIVKLFS